MKISYFHNICNALVASTQGSTAENCNKISTNKSFGTRIKQVATVSLIFLSMVTGEVFAGDKKPKSKANASRKKEVTFEAMHLSNNLPDVVPVPPAPPAPPMALSQPDLVSVMLLLKLNKS